ncbi:ArsJ-associated glyceraldehyde-3-phosphate dehydrogenase [Accumulibacter sp.]|uniref:ArsJ-associated glyceraldehyde-3-phosphate dehydrogenase n=1 Tax=Accumulibacter sp. TaxID=2053492 RepID=UPI0025D7901E|nr:ArsJ-associated glyceraldehyde-3-phosphate dehydrogenase [Accumulibacter sp.]MCM8595229.1 ArsJ-associated glyceraldehyde-3-phosphate dehydrogenase [Accumulibacter sp.]MCM8626862.1 ArsJ-associated glyceraldehyde-3-phosphate dehydrogenase [Accumulibacter sp.]MDS4049375.1 ArsJ-associated glyceraldehyde-3-phosphate dehydrogenase [Accumulibacter sp.]
MTVRVAINGFGRIGRLALRAAWEFPGIEFVHINEANGPVESAAHLLEFDSVHGRWRHEIGVSDGRLLIDGRSLSYSSSRDVAAGRWREVGADIVLEASGKWRTVETLAAYLDAGVKKVIVAAPVKGGEALNVVMGVNDALYDPQRHHIVTAASCTTNCLAPVVKVVHEGIGIAHGMITTIHSSTNTQSVHDQMHKDLRRARASSLSLVPTTTGSATAIALIFPELRGKLDGHAVRVPLLNASLTDCVFEMRRPTSVEEVNGLLRAAAAGQLEGILGFEERPLVSMDYCGDPRSSIVDAASTLVIDGTLVKIYAWYDNEWGYANRYVELARKVAASL